VHTIIHFTHLLNTMTTLVRISTNDILYDRGKAPHFSRIRIGKGTFGEVYRGRWNGKRVAIKEFEYEFLQVSIHHDTFIAEVQMLASLDHPNLVKFLGASIHNPPADETPFIVFELLETTLFTASFVAPYRFTSIQEKCVAAAQLASGLEYLHNNLKVRVVHHDLQPENIMLDANNTLKIIDFGMSSTAATKMDTARVRINNCPGTVGYMPPEKLMPDSAQCFRRSSAVDVYAFGTILWEMFSHTSILSLFNHDKTAVNEGIIKSEQLPLQSSIPRSIYHIINQCRDFVPGLRPRMNTVHSSIQHILSQHDFDTIYINPDLSQDNRVAIIENPVSDLPQKTIDDLFIRRCCLNHASIVALLGGNTLSRPSSHVISYVFEYAPTHTLASIISDLPNSDLISIKLSDALTYLHSHTPPIVVRSLSVDTVYVDPSKEIPVLFNFGLSHTTPLYQPGYAPPEVLAGATDTLVWSDIFAFGTILWQLCTKTLLYPPTLSPEQRNDYTTHRTSLPDATISQYMLYLVNTCRAFDPCARPQMFAVRHAIVATPASSTAHMCMQTLKDATSPLLKLPYDCEHPIDDAMRKFYDKHSLEYLNAKDYGPPFRRALYGFTANRHTQLTFDANDVLFECKNIIGSIWATGTLVRTGEHGLFPLTFTVPAHPPDS